MKIGMFDLETTGLSFEHDRVVEFALVVVEDKEITYSRGDIVNMFRPGEKIHIPKGAYDVHGISWRDVKDRGLPWMNYSRILFKNLSAVDVYAGQNLRRFDVPMLSSCMKRAGLYLPEKPIIDTLEVARRYVRNTKNYKLETLCDKYGISLAQAHRALDDITANAHLLIKMMDDLDLTVDQLVDTDYGGRLGKYCAHQDPAIAIYMGCAGGKK